MKRSFIYFFVTVFFSVTHSHAMEALEKKGLPALFQQLEVITAQQTQRTLLIINKQYVQTAGNNACNSVKSKKAHDGMRGGDCDVLEVIKNIILSEQVSVFGNEINIRSAMRERKFCQNQPPAAVGSGCNEPVLVLAKTMNRVAQSIPAYKFFESLINVTEELSNDPAFAAHPLVVHNYQYLLKELDTALEMTNRLQ